MRLSLCCYSSLVFLQVLFQRCIHISAIFRHTYVDITPSSLSVPAYQRHSITCKASYRGEAPDVEWYKNPGIRLDSNPRFRTYVTYDQYDTVVSSRLVFLNSLPSDSGTYSCVMVSASGIAEVSVKFWEDCLAIDPFTAILTVENTCEAQYPYKMMSPICNETADSPSLAKCRRARNLKRAAPVLEPSVDVTVRNGGEHSIVCKVLGGFDGTMFWSKDGRYVGTLGSFDINGDRLPDVRILPQSRSLTILKAKASDAGIYHCRFSYNVGRQRKSLDSTINVYAGVDLKSDSYILWQGNQNTPLKVKCLATGYPLPTVSWSYTTQKISLQNGAWNGNISIQDTQASPVLRQSVLRIAQMPGFFNITKFNCKGENPISSKSNTIMVVNVGTTLVPGSRASGAPSYNVFLLSLATLSADLLRRNMR